MTQDGAVLFRWLAIFALRARCGWSWLPMVSVATHLGAGSVGRVQPGVLTDGVCGERSPFRDNRAMAAGDIRIQATVRGRVQMVGFRAFVLDHAWNLEVRGTVANRPDGSVECLVEGPRDQVERLIQILREGPSSARVDAVDVVEQPVRGDLPPMHVTA